MLAIANGILKKDHPDLHLVVLDALRPRQVQQRLWAHVKGTVMQGYIANPRTGSMHNHGCAVDITLADRNGRRLDMGTPVDHFGLLSQPRLEQMFLRKGKLTQEQVKNRNILRRVMVAAGFRPLPIEWWHFDALPKKIVRKTYPVYE